MITYNGERIVDAAFAEQVYEAVARIPRGKVATYGQIAAQVGDTLAGREVGHIMSCAPSGRNLPCHRVVNRTGALAPDYASAGRKTTCFAGSGGRNLPCRRANRYGAAFMG